MSRTVVLLAFVIAGVSASGCDTNGYASLGDPLDVIVPCGADTTVWVRSVCGRNAQDTEDGHLMTEFITLGAGSLDPATPSEGCFNISQLHYDTSSRLRVGSFTTRGAQIEAAFGLLYTFTLEEDVGVLSRTGSDRVPLDPTERITYTFELSPDGTTLTLTDSKEGEPAVYRNLVDVVETLDLAEESDARTFSNISAITMYHAFTRLLGYGSGGMTQYYNNSAIFLAASQGHLEVRVSDSLFNPLTTLTFVDFEEFGGFVLDGEFYTKVNAGGNGSSYGELGLVVPRDLADASAVYTGGHHLTDVDVTDGYAGAGCYQLWLEDYQGAPLEVWIPSEIYNSIDLSRSLPTDGNAPGSVEPVCPNHVPRTPTLCPRI